MQYIVFPLHTLLFPEIFLILSVFVIFFFFFLFVLRLGSFFPEKATCEKVGCKLCTSQNEGRTGSAVNDQLTQAVLPRECTVNRFTNAANIDIFLLLSHR